MKTLLHARQTDPAGQLLAQFSENMIVIPPPRFRLGAVVATPGATEALEQSRQSPWEFWGRHVSGDWGELDDEDRLANDRAVHDGSRIFSVYRTAANVKIYVITESDRSSTCILLPDEY